MPDAWCLAMSHAGNEWIASWPSFFSFVFQRQPSRGFHRKSEVAMTEYWLQTTGASNHDERWAWIRLLLFLPFLPVNGGALVLASSDRIRLWCRWQSMNMIFLFLYFSLISNKSTLRFNKEGHEMSGSISQTSTDECGRYSPDLVLTAQRWYSRWCLKT